MELSIVELKEARAVQRATQLRKKRHEYACSLSVACKPDCLHKPMIQTTREVRAQQRCRSTHGATRAAWTNRARAAHKIVDALYMHMNDLTCVKDLPLDLDDAETTASEDYFSDHFEMERECPYSRNEMDRFRERKNFLSFGSADDSDVDDDPQHSYESDSCDSSKVFALRIRLLNGEPIVGLGEVQVRSDDKAEVLVTAIADVSGTSRWQLFFEGCELSAHDSIVKYGMVDGATVNAVITPEGAIERTVWRLLNTTCPDNLPTVVEQLVRVSLNKLSDLDLVISSIFQKVLHEPHHCETYADMVLALRLRYPEFEPDGIITEAQKRGTSKHTQFTRVLLNTCQNAFESLPETLEPTEEEKEQMPADELLALRQQKQENAVATVKFTGHLFVRQLMAVKVIGQIVHDLIGVKTNRGRPEEYMIECVCELLHITGPELDTTPNGKLLMSAFAARLTDLMRDSFSEPIQTQIRGVLERFRPQCGKGMGSLRS